VNWRSLLTWRKPSEEVGRVGVYHYGTGPHRELLDIPIVRDKVSLGVIHPRRQHVQETRGGISCHAHFGGSNGPEDSGYDARRQFHNHGERRSTGTTDALQERRSAGTANTVSKWRSTSTTDALLIAALIPQKLN